MKLKTTVGYYFRDNRRAIAIYYAVILALYILAGVEYRIAEAKSLNITIGGFDFATTIFVFVLGLNAFRSPFGVFMQNGVSRKTCFTGFFILAGMTAVGMSAVDAVLAAAARLFMPYRPLIEQLYGDYGVLIALKGFVWMTAVNLFSVSLGYLITVLYYKMEKPVKILVSAGLPVLLLIVLPIVDAQWTGGRISRALGWLFEFVLGMKYGGLFFSALCFVCLAGLAAMFSWLGSRKAAVKQ
jgi:hypothetical protein